MLYAACVYMHRPRVDVNLYTNFCFPSYIVMENKNKKFDIVEVFERARYISKKKKKDVR